MKTRKIQILLPLLALAMPLQAVPMVEEVTFDNAPAAGEIDVDSCQADINLKTGPVSKVSVRVERVFDTSENDAREYVEKNPVTITRKGDRFIVKTCPRGSDRSWFGRNGPARTTVDIVVPADYSARLDTTSGNINASGTAGRLQADSTSGRIRLSDITGNINADSTSGEITLERCDGVIAADSTSGAVSVLQSNGRIKVDTTSGDIEIRSCNGEFTTDSTSGDILIQQASGSWVANTSSGDIKAGHLGPVTAASSIETASGDVELQLAPATSLRVIAETSSGNLSAPGGDIRPIRDDRTLISFGSEDAAELRIETASGDIKLAMEKS